MKLEEKQKQLEMALTDHKPLKINWCERDFILTWNEDIKNYQGYNKELDLEFGIWPIDYLLKVINGIEKDVFIEVING